jgi:hypothetical protein
VVDVAIQGLVQSEDKLRHATKSPSQVLQNSLSRRPHMSASGGKADRPFAGNALSRSLLGVKRTWLVAAHMSAFDPKRTLPGAYDEISQVGLSAFKE